MIALFRQAFERRDALDPDLAAILENALPLGVLTDIVAHALGLPAEIKQSLLAEPRVDRRADVLLSILRRSRRRTTPTMADLPAPVQRQLKTQGGPLIGPSSWEISICTDGCHGFACEPVRHAGAERTGSQANPWHPRSPDRPGQGPIGIESKPTALEFTAARP